MRKVIYKGRVITLVKERRRLPNGRLADIDIIRHPGAVLIVPFLSKDKVVLLRQFRPALDMTLYELPAGTLNKGERQRACAFRELIEETGVAARTLVRIGEIYPVPGYSTEKIVIYTARGLTPCFKQADMDEVITRHVFSKSGVKRLFRSGALTDAKTIVALALCRWL